MARYSGFGGSMSITTSAGTLTGPVQTWNLDIQQDEWEQNAKGESFSEFGFGAKSYTVTMQFLVEVAVVENTHDIIGDEITAMTLLYTGGDLWTMGAGNAVVQQIAVSSPLDGPITWTITIRGKGSIAYGSAA